MGNTTYFGGFPVHVVSRRLRLFRFSQQRRPLVLIALFDLERGYSACREDDKRRISHHHEPLLDWGCTRVYVVHFRGGMAVDPRILTIPGRGTPGSRRPGRRCLRQALSLVRCRVSCMKSELHPTIQQEPPVRETYAWVAASNGVMLGPGSWGVVCRSGRMYHNRLLLNSRIYG